MKREPTKEELKSQERIIELINECCDGSQNEFAQRVGIGKSSVSQYVNGRNFPGNARAGEIAKAFDLNPLWVMGFDVPKRVTDQERKDMMFKHFIASMTKAIDDASKKEAIREMAYVIDKLNPTGIDRLTEYMQMLIENDKYTEEGD